MLEVMNRVNSQKIDFIYTILIQGESIEKENNKDWSKFEELLDFKQSDNSWTDDTFREFVSDDSEALRKNVEVLHIRSSPNYSLFLQNTIIENIFRY